MTKSKKASRPRVLLVIRSFVIDKKGRILIIKRSSDDRFDAGKWEIPGGKLDVGADVGHSIEREVFEETSLLVSPISKTPYFESFLLAEGPYTGLPYVVLVGISLLNSGKVKLSEEHTDFKWVTVKEFEKETVRDEVSRAFVVLKKELKKSAKSK